MKASPEWMEIMIQERSGGVGRSHIELKDKPREAELERAALGVQLARE